MSEGPPAVLLLYEHLVVHLVLRACWDDPEIGSRFSGNGWVLPHELEQRIAAFNRAIRTVAHTDRSDAQLLWREPGSAASDARWAHYVRYFPVRPYD